MNGLYFSLDVQYRSEHYIGYAMQAYITKQKKQQQKTPDLTEINATVNQARPTERGRPVL